MVSINKILTKIHFSEMLDYSGFGAEPEKVMQKGAMYVGKTGVKILDNLAICVNNQQQMDKNLLSMAYYKYRPINDQIKIGNNIKNSFNHLADEAKRDVSKLYAKKDLLKMVETNKSYTSSFLMRAQDELQAAHKAMIDYPGWHSGDPKLIELNKTYNQKLDEYYKEMAQTMMIKEVIQEVITTHKERPLNKLARLFGI